MDKHKTNREATAGHSPSQIHTCCWTWASDKICSTCCHYDYRGFCNIDDKRVSSNGYCSHWKP